MGDASADGAAHDGPAGPDARTADAPLGTDGGTCGACNTPPDACHARTGTCMNGTCVYAFVNGATCDDGNDCTVGDTCTNGGCFGTPLVCDTPPAAVCLSGEEARTYDSVGTCNSGLCVYTSHDVTCSGSCTNGSCGANTCAGVTCNAPPSSCYQATGTCSDGSCSYGYHDGVACDDNNACTSNDQCNTGQCKGVPKSCGAPPANSCVNATTLKAYAPLGTCAPADGTCSYSYSFENCPAGCSGDACNPLGWQTMTSNTGNELYGVWGASESAVWAVGSAGTLVFYNGQQWQVRTTPSQALGKDLYDITGSAADNVFLAVDRTILRFDGAHWTVFANLDTAGTAVQSISGMYATGDAQNHLYVSAEDYINQTIGFSLYLIDSTGTITRLGGTDDSVSGDCQAPGKGIGFLSPTDIYFSSCYLHHWDGHTVTDPAGTAIAYAQRMYVADDTHLFGIAYSNDFGATGENVTLGDGTSWMSTSIGLNGVVSDLSGTSNSRVFFSGYDSTAKKGAIIYYDGLGFTSQPLPDTVQEWLYAVWAAPNGQVFAVGSGGRIVTGP
jgi:hypothetical protein